MLFDLTFNHHKHIYGSAFKTQITRITDNVTKKQSSIIYISKDNYPQRFILFLQKEFNIDQIIFSPLNETDWIEDLKGIKSSNYYLDKTGLDIIYFNNKSLSNRIFDLMSKTVGKKHSKVILFIFDEKNLLQKLTFFNKHIIKIDLMELYNLRHIIDYELSLFGLINLNAFKYINAINTKINLNMIKKIMEEFMDTLLYINNNKEKTNYPFSLSLLNDVIYKIKNDTINNITNIVEIINIYDEIKSPFFQVSELLKQKYDEKNIDLIYYHVKKEKHNLNVINKENNTIYKIFNKDIYTNQIYTKSINEIYDNINLIKNKTEQQILKKMNLSHNELSDLEFYFKRNFSNDSILNNYFVFLFRDIVSPYIDFEIDINELKSNLIKYTFPPSERTDWNKALDIYQNTDNLKISKIIIFNILNHRYKNKLTPAYKSIRDIIDNIIKTKHNIIKNTVKMDNINLMEINIYKEIYKLIQISLIISDLNFENDINRDNDNIDLIIQILNSIDYINIDSYKNILTNLYDYIILGKLIPSTKPLLLKHTYEIICYIDQKKGFEKDVKILESHYNNIKNINQMSVIDVQNTSLELINKIMDNQYVYKNNVNALINYKKFVNIYTKIITNINYNNYDHILKSTTIKALIYNNFNISNQAYPEHLKPIFNDKYTDILLIIIDAMPNAFVELFSNYPKDYIILEKGFSTIPSETGPGHLTIFSGKNPSETLVFENTLRTDKIEKKLIISDKGKLQTEFHPLLNYSLINALDNANVNCTVFMPSGYKSNPLKELLMGKNQNNIDFRLFYNRDIQAQSNLLYNEASMIPFKNDSNLYILMDNEIDSKQHSESKSYFYDEKEIRDIKNLYSNYYLKVETLLKKIYANAKNRNKKLLTIITSDHGISILKNKNTNIKNFFNECGLSYINRSGYIVNGPEPYKLRGGIYSHLDIELFKNTDLCHKIFLRRDKIIKSQLGVLNLNRLNDPKRNIILYLNLPNTLDDLSYIEIKCANCNFIGSGIKKENILCPKCGSKEYLILKEENIKNRMNSLSDKYKVVLSIPQNINSIKTKIRKPSLIIYPYFDEIFSEYPSQTREEIVYLIEKNKTKTVRELEKVYKEYKENKYEFKDFSYELENLINLGVIEKKGSKLSLNNITEYGGTCTWVTHGGTSPSETIIPFIFIKNMPTVRTR